jgi:hypothetical protein
VICTPGSGAELEVNAMTAVTCTATDVSGNAATCGWEVVVRDHEAPRLACPIDRILSTAAQSDMATLTYTLPLSSDNVDTRPSVACSVPSGGQLEYSAAAHRVVCTATDASGNVGNCTFDVQVTDKERPVFASGCPRAIAADAVVGTRAGPVTYELPQASDNVGLTPEGVVCRPRSGSNFAVGDTTVTCEAKDPAGNAAFCDTTVTVRDSTPPLVTCPAAVSVAADGENGLTAEVSFPGAVAVDDSGVSPALTYSQESGSVFDVGATVVTVTAADGAGNKNTCNFNVVVRDVTPPTIVCPSTAAVYTTDPGEAVVTIRTFDTSTVVATDNILGSTPTIVCAPESGSARVALGRHSARCVATDDAGNEAECRAAFDVVDKEPPVLDCTEVNKVIFFGETAGTVVLEPAVRDNSGLAVEVTCSPASGSSFALGTSTATCTATDTAGNEAQCTFSVHVEEGEVDCEGAWSAWSSCSVCPLRRQRRTFEVDVQPSPGGRQCPGPISERACVNAPSCRVLESSAVFSPVDGAIFQAEPQAVKDKIAMAFSSVLSDNLATVVPEAIEIAAGSLRPIGGARRREGDLDDALSADLLVHLEDGNVEHALLLLERMVDGDDSLLADLFVALQPGPSCFFCGLTNTRLGSVAESAASNTQGSNTTNAFLGLILGVVFAAVMLIALVVVIVIRRQRRQNRGSGDRARSKGDGNITGLVNPMYMSSAGPQPSYAHPGDGLGDLDDGELNMGMFEQEDGLYAEPDALEAGADLDGYLDVQAYDEEEIHVMDAMTQSAMRDMARADSMIAKRKVERLEENMQRENAELRHRLDMLTAAVHGPSTFSSEGAVQGGAPDDDGTDE